MRKVTQQSISEFMSGNSFKSGNTKVESHAYLEAAPFNKYDVVTLSLHDNIIAYREKQTGKIHITNCGWFSNTTKERLNGLPNVSIQQSKGVWYLNGKAWDGKMITL